MKTCVVPITAFFAFCFGSSALAQNSVGTISIDADHPGHAIGKNFYGLMTEEINHAYDGGLYGELIQNRSFRDSTDQPIHWTLLGPNGTLTFEPGTVPAIKLEAISDSAEVRNSGYWGIPIRPNTNYRLTIRARSIGSSTANLKVSIRSNSSTSQLARAQIKGVSKDWKTYRLTLKSGPGPESLDNQFALSLQSPGAIEINYVSLFPPTFDKRPNGNRIDLMKLMGQMKPGFLRLPGGNYLEGDTVATRFEWKDTLGKPEDRSGHQGPWGYRSSDGLGLLEFLEWCEDLRMKPLLAVYAGYSLRGETVKPGSDLAPFVEDALDEIEYVSGPPTSKWGAIRARDGHPKPFPLEYVEIGNEDWFDRSGSYGNRYAQFADAIKAKYPKLQLIATGRIDTRRPDVVDDHYYRSAANMAADAGHYDSYNRSDPKIFVGEWASTEGRPTPTLKAALGDAAWLTGLERDSDVVVMEAYAPLLVNVNPGASQWGTNLIGYDALHSFGSPSFYVQSMYASYTGDVVVPSKVDYSMPPSPPKIPSGTIGLGTWLTDAEFKDLKVTRGSEVLYQSHFATGNLDIKQARGTWKLSEGTYRETALVQGAFAFGPDAQWQDYTYSLKARKVSGREGFLIPVHVDAAHNTYWRWNVGGWGNTRSRIQRVDDGSEEEIGTSSTATVELNRWYDLKIEVGHGEIRCYLDGKLVNEAKEEYRLPVNDVYTAVSKRLKDGRLFAKIVNFTDNDLPLNINIHSARHFKGVATGLVIQGDPNDVNSVSEPYKVAPKKISQLVANSFLRTFPAHSVTVLEIPSD